MSLNYDLTRVEDKDWIWIPITEVYGPDSYHVKNDPEGKVMNPRMEALIFATMSTDIGRITEANYEEFYQRYLIWHRCVLGETNPYLKLEDVKKGIGLSTNAHTATMAAFKKDTWERMVRVIDQ